MCRHRPVYVDEYCVRPDGNIHGSDFRPEETLGRVLVAGVLTVEQIRKRYNLSVQEYVDIEGQVLSARVLDALFAWPQGPRYDILLHRVANCG